MNAALLLIDLQHDYLVASGLEPGAGVLGAQAARLLGVAREAGLPVVHVWTTIREDSERMPHWQAAARRWCVEGTPGHVTPPDLLPAAGEQVVHKRFFSAFTDERLTAHLRGLDVDTVILTGLHLRACVRTTALDAYQRGFSVWIAADAVADDDPLHAALTRQYLSARGIEFPTIAAIRLAIAAPTADAGAGPAAPRLAPILPECMARRNDDLAVATLTSPAAHRTPLWSVPLTRQAEATAAANTARQVAAVWAQTTGAHRCELFTRLLTRLDAEAEGLARQITCETGKPIRQSRLELRYSTGLIQSALRYAQAEDAGAAGEGWSVRRQPHGVVAVVTPWNNPLAIPLGKIAPALLYGNAVVWKPALPGAGIAARVFDLLRECGCPEGLVTVLNGDHVTAECLISAPAVAAVTLTGSSAAGACAQALCARRRIPLQAELGGNNAAIVWPDADLPVAAALLARGAFGAAGQRCTASRRVIVHQECYAEFVLLLQHATRSLKWGDPGDEEVEIGPLISEAAVERVTALVERARAAGAQVLQPHLGQCRAVPAATDGWYFPPTLLLGLGQSDEAVQEEQFAPLMVVQPAMDWEQALSMCNGVRQGLIASLFSRSPEVRARFLAGAEAGMLKINVPPDGAAPDAPFSAWKESGVGLPEHGSADREFFRSYQVVYDA